MKADQNEWMQAADPRSSDAQLRYLATIHPELRGTVAANPSARPELLQWLRSTGDPEVLRVLNSHGVGARTPMGGYQPQPLGQNELPRNEYSLGLIIGGIVIVAVLAIVAAIIFLPGIVR